ncbi:hypothetical protein PR048_010791 [Dryococelus australis]|uniref:Uncharacterized protein n=1 Tax=Dryococelus australis TaxID=614101 RepID=A0ABQ9I3Q4_9NEOP|nr:hypothetical protein PR048_010791 [Dryococelus australis]
MSTGGTGGVLPNWALSPPPVGLVSPTPLVTLILQHDQQKERQPFRPTFLTCRKFPVAKRRKSRRCRSVNENCLPGSWTIKHRVSDSSISAKLSNTCVLRAGKGHARRTRAVCCVFSRRTPRFARNEYVKCRRVIGMFHNGRYSSSCTRPSTAAGAVYVVFSGDGVRDSVNLISPAPGRQDPSGHAHSRNSPVALVVGGEDCRHDEYETRAELLHRLPLTTRPPTATTNTGRQHELPAPGSHLIIVVATFRESSCMLASTDNCTRVIFRAIGSSSIRLSSRCEARSCLLLLASHLGEPGSIPNRVAPACRKRAGRCYWWAGFLGDLPFPPPIHSGAAPYLASLIDSQGLDFMTVLCREVGVGKGGGGDRRMLSNLYKSREGTIQAFVPTPRGDGVFVSEKVGAAIGRGIGLGEASLPHFIAFLCLPLTTTIDSEASKRTSNALRSIYHVNRDSARTSGFRVRREGNTVWMGEGRLRTDLGHNAEGSRSSGCQEVQMAHDLPHPSPEDATLSLKLLITLPSIVNFFGNVTR